MSCTKYKSAVDAAKEAVIHGLNTNEETNTLAELWRHYLGLRYIADNHRHVEEDTISLGDSSSAYDFNLVGAAQPVPFTYGYGEDVISFGDTVIKGGSATDTISFG